MSTARPVPIKNDAGGFRLYFALRLNTGALNSGAAGLDSEYSIDGGAFQDCSNEAIEIATASGMYYLDLLQAEINGDCICVIVKSSTTNAVTADFTIYTAAADGTSLPVDVQALKASATAAGHQKDLALQALYGTVNANNVQPTITTFE